MGLWQYYEHFIVYVSLIHYFCELGFQKGLWLGCSQ